MLKTFITRVTIPLLLLFSNSSGDLIAKSPAKSAESAEGPTGTLERMIVANGSVAMDLDLKRLNGAAAAAEPQLEPLRFAIAPNSFFTMLVLNDLLRGPEPSSMALIPQNSAALPAALNASFQQLVVEKRPSDEEADLVVRDAKTGFVFFTVDGHQYNYDGGQRTLRIDAGRLLVSKEFAQQLGNVEANAIVGNISIAASVYPIEIDKIVNGSVQSAIMPPLRHDSSQGTQPSGPRVGTAPGPDVIVGDLPAVTQAGSASGFVGLGVATTSCNNGVLDLDWFQLPSNDHPVIPQNMYRMSGGTTNNDRFEQIGQGQMKHAFTALTENICSFGCNGVGGSHLGSGCSDPYSASLNSDQARLGSRAWVNPFTGVYPRGDSATNPNNHTGHSHTGTTHRLLVPVADLDTTQNAGATYFAEGQYVTPHEFLWCSQNPSQCVNNANMKNNASYRRYNVTGTASFTFSAAASTVRTEPAINAWRAAHAAEPAATQVTLNQIEPAPGADGIGYIGYRVTNPSAGVWHYEYVVYNQNLDRAIQSFTVPVAFGTG